MLTRALLLTLNYYPLPCTHAHIVVQVAYSRTKLNTLVKIPVNGLDMTPYLAPRAPARPGSATLERRTKIGHVPRTSKTFPSKSVTFQDQSQNKGGSKKLHKNSSGRWWKKSKKEGDKLADSVLTTCDSPASIRSAPPHSVTNGYQSPEHHLSSPAHSGVNRSLSLGDSSMDNIYDLYAICNHTGSMNRGHYTAYCRNPADGHWYGFDDVNVQPVPEDKLITPGAYMLFYVRQSLLVQSPLSSSDSSASSGSTSHWTQHIPHFKMDLTDQTTPQHSRAAAPPRPRLASTNSAASAPPTSGMRGLSPPNSTGDDHHGNSPAHSLPQYQQQSLTLSQPSYPSSPATTVGGYQRTFSNGYPQKHSISKALSSPGQARVAASGRHPSLRLGKVPPTSGYMEDDLNLRRGASFHAPRQHNVMKTGPGVPLSSHFPPSRPVLPSRSIPNMSTDSPDGYPLPQEIIAPSRSISNMPQEMSPPPGQQRYLPPSDLYDHFATRSSIKGTARHNESCV